MSPAERNPWHPEHERAEALRIAFAREMEATTIRWSTYNVTRLLRSTGERPERVDEAWGFLMELGMGPDARRAWPTQSGAFDHGVLWARGGRPWAIVGAPYELSSAHRFLLETLGRSFPTIRVAIDDRPSYYGFGTCHVRIEVPEPRRPYCKPLATRATQTIKRQFAAALRER